MDFHEYTDPKDMGEHTSPICSTHATIILYLVCLPLSVPLTEHAGVIRLESDSKWHFTHARPHRAHSTAAGVCIPSVCHISTANIHSYTHHTHTAAAQLHTGTHKHMSQILNP